MRIIVSDRVDGVVRLGDMRAFTTQVVPTSHDIDTTASNEMSVSLTYSCTNEPTKVSN